jgi:hypothetical protein
MVRGYRVTQPQLAREWIIMRQGADDTCNRRQDRYRRSAGAGNSATVFPVIR